MSDLDIRQSPLSDPEGSAAAGRAEAPFIIWTFRRTGGTSLRSIFFWLSRFKAWQDEAFNRGRELGHITGAFEDSNDHAALERDIAAVIAERKNLKHCIEVVPYEVTSTLLRHSADAGYRHLILLRLNEVDRLLSLNLARMTRAWGPEEAARAYAEIRDGTRVLEPLNLRQLRRDLDRDAAALGRLMRAMFQHRITYGMTLFEDLYEGPIESRLAEVRRVAALLGLDRAQEEADSAFTGTLIGRSQGTRDIYSFVPNYEEARETIESLTR